MASQYLCALGRRLFFISVIFFSVPSFAVASDTVIHELWSKSVANYLRANSWEAGQSEHASSVLMIPMHYSFMVGDKTLIAQFSDHFNRFLGASAEYLNWEDDDLRLSKLEYLYLLSQFLWLENEHGVRSGNDAAFRDLLKKVVGKLWLEVPAWQWERRHFKNMKSRIQVKLANDERTYHLALIDEEGFFFGIVWDLLAIGEKGSLVSEIGNDALKLVNRRLEITQDGQLKIQPGYFSEHPDYKWAGRYQEVSAMKPLPINNISVDTAHASRWALWLRSAIQAEAREKKQARLESLLNAMRRTFLTKVLIHPSDDFIGYRTTNYSDGNNGVYRWGYGTQGVGEGYGPSENSSYLFEGWAAFLGGAELELVYNNLASILPLDLRLMRVYGGATTVERKLSYVKEPERFETTLKKAICLMAARVAKSL